MNLRALATFVSVLAATTTLQQPRLAGAEGSGFRLPPWFSDNAVVVPTDRTRSSDPAVLLFDGWTRGRKAPLLRLAPWPKDPLGTSMDDRARAADQERRWYVLSSQLDYDPDQNLRRGMNFSLRIEGGGKPGDDVRTVPNLSVGPVWLLGMDAARDQYHPPELTLTALRRVRVLALDHLNPQTAAGEWVFGDTLRTNAPSLFTGLARAFANQIVDDRIDQGRNDTVGLVLVPARTLKALLANRPDFKPISGYRFEQPQSDTLVLAGLNAAMMANSHENIGARRRVELARKQHRERLTELKREGRTDAPFVADHQEWNRLQPIASPKSTAFPDLLPFRVTGILWEAD